MSNTFKVGDRVVSLWIDTINQTGVISDDYKVLGLRKSDIAIWKKMFVLVKWDHNGSTSGELKRYISKI